MKGFEQSMTASELIASREPTFHEISPDAKRLVVCSDERGVTVESQQLLAETYGVDPTRYNRDFGGKHGASHDAAIVIAAQHGAETFDAVVGNNEGDTFTATTDQLIEQSSGNTVIAIDHSADHNEHNPAHTNMDSEEGLGCAFDALFGAILATEATNAEVQAEARKEFASTVNPDTTAFEKTIGGAQKVYAAWCQNNASFGFSRADIARTAAPDSQGQPAIAILGGSHVSLDKVVDIANYVPNSVSPASEAIEQDVPAFVTDMADTTLQLIRAFRKLKSGEVAGGIELDPEYIFAAKILKRAAVRFALAGNRANTMTHVERGDAHEALAYIRGALQNAA